MAEVRDLMTPDPLTLSLDATVLQALRMMEQVVVRHLPVCSGDRVVGMVSDRDLRATELGEWAGESSAADVHAYLSRPISELMSTDVVTISPDAPVREAVGRLIEHRISALPVVENEVLVGMLSTVDILRTLR
jgi:CBS domain-containing protein